MKKVPEIFEFWEMLRDERRLEQPHATDAEWEKIEAQYEAEQAALAQANGQPNVHA
jgi:hypothetical protein